VRVQVVVIWSQQVYARLCKLVNLCSVCEARHSVCLTVELCSALCYITAYPAVSHGTDRHGKTHFWARRAPCASPVVGKRRYMTFNQATTALETSPKGPSSSRTPMHDFAPLLLQVNFRRHRSPAALRRCLGGSSSTSSATPSPRTRLILTARTP
jgi:hypothetical protein